MRECRQRIRNGGCDGEYTPKLRIQEDNRCLKFMNQWWPWALLLCVFPGAVAGQYQDRDRPGAPKTTAAAPLPENRIDINHASEPELLKVPGMTESWAGRILRFRPYRTKLDLLEKGIVSGPVYDRIKDFIIAHRDPQ